MTLKLNRDVAIDNVGGYDSEVVEQLRGLLAAGAPAEADPKRAGFYDLDAGSRGFYIHISPVSGKVLLLASWRNESLSEADSAQVSAHALHATFPAMHCCA